MRMRTAAIADIEDGGEVALALGYRHTRGLQSLSRLLCHHGRGSKPCPLCDGVLSTSLLGHVLDVRA